MDIKEIISSGLLEMYALGLALPAEKEQLEAMLTRYPELQQELTAIEIAMGSYASAHAIEPANVVKSRLMNALESGVNNNDGIPVAGKTLARVVGISPAWKWIAAASILLLIVSSVMNAVYYNKYIQTNTAYRETQDKLATQSRQMEDLDKGLSVVQNKYSMPIALNGLPAAPDAAAKIFWMKNTGEVYIDPSNLPEPPSGKQYQLWAIVDGKPVDAGMIVTSKRNKYSIQKMKTFGRAEAFAVTLEKQGGNPTPQGEMYVMGKM
jgi:anti-sigma-K factor RskA